MRLTGKVDANQPEIVAALRNAGATVVSLANVGGGCPDILVGFRGDTFLMEIKAQNGKLTDHQEKFHDLWLGKPITIVRSADEALAAIGALKV